MAARGLQGAGAALLAPTTLAIIAAAFPLEKERARAIGLWAATSALAFAVGPVTGGAIAQHVHWSWIFWINVPVGLVGWLIARTAIAESRDETATRRIDVADLLTSGAALLALVYALIEGNSHGWTSPLIVILLGVAGLGFSAFLVIEGRTQAATLDLSLFRDRTFAAGNALQVLSGFGIFGVYFFLSLYVQGILGFSATKAGLVFVPMALLITVIAPASQKAVEQVGAAATIATGMLLSAVGFVLLERLGQTASFAELMPGLLLIGASHAAAFVDGYQIGLYVSAAVMAAGALLALVALRSERAAPSVLSAVPETT